MSDNESGEKTRKVAIVGSASSSRDLTPWNDDSFEFWGLAWRADLKRKHRVFDMHEIDENRKRVPPDYLKFLATHQCPVFLLQARKDLPNSVTYPLEDVSRFISELDGGNTRNYFVCSIAYMLALAMAEGVPEIHIYGVDLVDVDEYGYQRPNLEYMIGLARGRGYKIYIPDRSALCKFPYLYGYENDPGDNGIINVKLLEKREAEYKMRHERAIAEAHTLDGALQEVRQLKSMILNRNKGVQT